MAHRVLQLWHPQQLHSQRIKCCGLCWGNVDKHKFVSVTKEVSHGSDVIVTIRHGMIHFNDVFIGHGLTLQHLRYNSECDVYEELEPIDKNLQYDFNYQQINHLTREVTVLPVSVCVVCSLTILLWYILFIYFLQGDIIQLKCFYGTEGVDGVTLVSDSTTVCVYASQVPRIHNYPSKADHLIIHTHCTCIPVCHNQTSLTMAI